MASQQQRRRKWIIQRDDPKFTDPQTGYPSEQMFRAAVENELAAWENTGHRLGRGLIAAPIREEVITGEYETTGWLFEDIFVPAAKTEQAPVQAAETPLPDLSDVVPEDEPAEEPQAA